MFPVAQGTYYNPSELRLTINLSNTTSQSAKITHTVYTEQKTCDITLAFVPTAEIARALYTYRNSILKFNPRSYLELSHNQVNQEIARSITGLKTNQFTLFNKWNYGFILRQGFQREDWPKGQGSTHPYTTADHQRRTDGFYIEQAI